MGILLVLALSNALKAPANKGQKFLQRRVQKGKRQVAWQCPYYSVYSELVLEPDNVCEEWQNSFTKFKMWMSTQNHEDRMICTRDMIHELGESNSYSYSNSNSNRKPNP